jgi:hypothetical protein
MMMNNWRGSLSWLLLSAANRLDPGCLIMADPAARWAFFRELSDSQLNDVERLVNGPGNHNSEIPALLQPTHHKRGP